MKEHLIFSVGIVGVRGFVGKELVSLIDGHPSLKLDWVSSRELNGQPLSKLAAVSSELKIECLSAQQIAERKTDIVILALPNQVAANFVNSLLSKKNNLLIIDLSADYRFDNNWHYSLPEINKFIPVKLNKNKPLLISNPGCYATAMQLAIAPLKKQLSAAAHCFGISGYSGAGTSPSTTNQPENLQHNIIPYQLVEHLHEKEVSCQLDLAVSFTPHVADFFRGITMTVQLHLKQPITESSAFKLYHEFYLNQPFVKCQQAIPSLRQVTKTHCCLIGGFKVSEDGRRLTIISCLDNLLKGAASQAIQNINLALNLNPTLGLSDSINNFQLIKPL